MKRRFLKALVIGMIVCAACCLVSCSKDMILGIGNAVISSIGDDMLTKDYDLKGRREFGTDSYTGTYSGEYENDTVHELLFGNTSIERKSGNTVRIFAEITEDQGSGTLLIEKDGKAPEVLLDGAGTLDTELDVCPGSAYILFEAEDFTGTLNVSIE